MTTELVTKDNDDLTSLDNSLIASKLEKIANLSNLIADNKPLRTAYNEAGITLTDVVRLTSSRSTLSKDLIAAVREELADTLAVSGLLLLSDADSEDIPRVSREVDYRKWMASKLLPSRYGDKQQLEVSGQIAVVPVVNIANAITLSENINSPTVETGPSLPTPKKKHA